MKLLKFYKFRFCSIILFLLVLTVPLSSSAVKNVINNSIVLNDDIIYEYIDTSPPKGSGSAPTVRTLNLKETLEQIDSDAAQALAQIDKQLLEFEAALKNPKVRDELEKRKAQFRVELTEFLNDEQKYKEALENPYFPQNIKYLLMRAKKNPEEIDKFIEEQFQLKNLAEQQKLEIRKRRDLAKKQARERALRMKLR
ncbi:hypothetical protein NIES4071_107900 (plasmid) [Calothrix sp. NIES-4071]|nr:hypothetical protein NIES4071_107900 [Calothrix sp. NIES-4071]BAZ64830.1 hypothetical protein NIES4105_105630 [Calothrix sp. NIES-4105]